MSIVSMLTAQEKFTESDKKIADFIMENKERIGQLYVQEVAKESYTSHSGVIRLCKKIGFSGYRSFKIAFIQEIQKGIHEEMSVNPNFPFDQQDSAIDIARKMRDLSIETIRKTFSLIDFAAFEKAVQLLSQADRIFLFAGGDSQIRARSFINKFNKINQYPILADEYGESNWGAVNMTASDCALFISYSNKSLYQNKIAQFLKTQKIPAILLSGPPNKKIAGLFEVVLEIPGEELAYMKVGTFSSQIAFEYLLNTLFSALYEANHGAYVAELKDKEFFIEQGMLKKQADS